MRRTMTDKGVAALKPQAKPYVYPDPELGGHYVRVRPSGNKSFWTVARDPQGKQIWTRIGLADMGVTAARERARMILARAREGGLRAVKEAALASARPRLSRAEYPGLTHLYRQYAIDGTLLYVGIALNFARRWGKHRGSHWADEVAVMTVEHYHTREDAERAETAAVIAEKPRYNRSVNLQPGSSRPAKKRNAPLVETSHEGAA